MAQAVKHMLCKHKARVSIPIPAPKKRVHFYLILYYLGVELKLSYLRPLMSHLLRIIANVGQ
jgi:hypothetical protein